MRILTRKKKEVYGRETEVVRVCYLIVLINNVTHIAEYDFNEN